MTVIREKQSAGTDTLGGERGRYVRRLAHGMIMVAALYYFLPDDLPVTNLPKWVLAPTAVMLVLVAERVRIRRSMYVPGLRPHEMKRLGSYTYAVIGSAIVVLIAPAEVGVPSIIAMAWADPVAGEIRNRGHSEVSAAITSVATYGAIFIIISVLIETDLAPAAILAACLAPVAVASESFDIMGIDDDFTMQVFPAVVGIVLWALFLQ
ncbi:hypothetical protein E2P47_05780 [Candidatus Bathyarchaeota archaeon]|nr:hypothetical protein E2P47_05780 [Candidatus Bathyarchaeota archaeon]